jgi:hypothetical protein
MQNKLRDYLVTMGMPLALTVVDARAAMPLAGFQELWERTKGRSGEVWIAKTLPLLGYVRVVNPRTTTGKWFVSNRQTSIWSSITGDCREAETDRQEVAKLYPNWDRSRYARELRRIARMNGYDPRTGKSLGLAGMQTHTDVMDFYPGWPARNG